MKRATLPPSFFLGWLRERDRDWCFTSVMCQHREKRRENASPWKKRFHACLLSFSLVLFLPFSPFLDSSSRNLDLLQIINSNIFSFYTFRNMSRLIVFVLDLFFMSKLSCRHNTSERFFTSPFFSLFRARKVVSNARRHALCIEITFLYCQIIYNQLHQFWCKCQHHC